MGKPYTTESFKIRVNELVGEEYSILSEYINSHNYIKIRHNSDVCNNHEYLVKPYHFINGKRCPLCARINSTERIKQSSGILKAQEARRITHDEFVSRVYSKFGNELKILGKYTNNSTKIECMHNSPNCNFSTFLKTPHDILQDSVCPVCNSKNKTERLKKFSEKRILRN